MIAKPSPDTNTPHCLCHTTSIPLSSTQAILLPANLGVSFPLPPGGGFSGGEGPQGVLQSPGDLVAGDESPGIVRRYMSVPQFHEHVRQQTDAIWQAIYTHPFVQEVGQGTLARPAFEFFIRQDYLYLKDFARVLCLGGAKADNLETLAMFAEHAATVVQVERTFHSNFALQLGLTVADLEATLAAPVTRAYTRHLLAVAHSGTLGETVAA